MNVALYYSRANRTRRQDQAHPLEEAAVPTPAPTRLLTESRLPLAEASNATVGFWMIPQSSKEYLKLKILSVYETEPTRALEKTRWRKPGFDPRSPWPVLPLVQNRRLLITYFRWIKSLLPEDMTDQPLFDPGSEDFENQAEGIVEALFYRKWRYFAVQGGVAYFGSDRKNDPFFNLVLSEVLDGKEQKPASVRVDVSSVSQFIVLDAKGRTLETLNPEQARARANIKPAFPENGEEEGAQELSSQEVMSEVRQRLDARQEAEALAFFITHIRNQDDLLSFQSEFLSRILSPKLIGKYLLQAFKLVPGDYERKLSRVRGILLSFIAACKKNGDPRAPTVDDYDDAIGLRESFSTPLEERSYYDLWNLTRTNGGYRRGGMRRIRGRWVYDSSVPGRSTNGARYVTTAPPRPMVDQDGKITLRFQYQSRPGRNTTGMSQIGYIKFHDHEAFLKTASRNIGLAIAKRDVWVACTCPDFRYRWHWVLAQDGSAPPPTGLGNAPPLQTNPDRKLSMCKHLSAVSVFLLNRPSAAYDKEIRKVIKKVNSAPTKPAPGKPGEEKTPEKEAGAEAEGDNQVVKPGAELGNQDAAPEAGTK